MNSTPSQDDYIKTALRMPRDLHAEVLASSQKNGRTLNAEMIALLTAAVKAGPTNADLFRQNIELKTLINDLIESVALNRK